jgi:hypothetical protein
MGLKGYFRPLNDRRTVAGRQRRQAPHRCQRQAPLFADRRVARPRDRFSAAVVALVRSRLALAEIGVLLTYLRHH